MKKSAKSKVVAPPQSAWENLLTKLAVLVSILLIVGGAIGMVLVQEELEQSQDFRPEASVADGLVSVSASQASVDLDQNSYINFYINTHGVQTDSVQLTFNVVTDTLDEPPIFELVDGLGLELASSEIEQTADGYLVSAIAIPSTIGEAFSNSSDVLFASLEFVPQSGGEFELNFDVENSISTIHASDPPKDELKHINQVSFVIVDDSASPSPSPTVEPTALPQNDTSGIGGNKVSSCNESCSSNSQCEVNHRCYKGQCRLVTNVSSTTCSTPPDRGLSFSCNEYCSNSGECADGLVCQNNSCRNPENLNSTTCQELSSAQVANLVKSCDQRCNSNAECDVNLRCYQGSCRLATNPGSSSCSPASDKTVSASIYTTQKGSDDGSPDATFSADARDDDDIMMQETAPTEQGQVTDQVGTEENALSFIAQYFKNNPQLPVILLGLGGGFAVLVILMAIVKKLRSNQSMPPKSGPGMNYADNINPEVENKLQAEIQNLKTQQINQPTQPATPPTAGPTPPLNNPSPSSSPSTPVPPNTMIDRTMMDKIRDRNVRPPGDTGSQVINQGESNPPTNPPGV